LRGDEIRACWEASTVRLDIGPVTPAPPVVTPFDTLDDGTPVRKLEFVEIGAAPVTSSRRKGAKSELPEPERSSNGEIPSPEAAQPRWSLWGEVEI
jgi:hypothetical protein